jgi:hypothetical protein
LADALAIDRKYCRPLSATKKCLRPSLNSPQLLVVGILPEYRDRLSAPLSAGGLNHERVDQWNGSGNWVTNASTDWSTGAPPASTDIAQIESGTSTLTTTTTVAGIAITDGATLDTDGGGSLGDTAGLTNFGTFNLDTGNGGGTATVNAVSNFGSITIGTSGLTASTTMTVATLANYGTIDLWGNSTLGTSDQATLDITGTALTNLTGKIYLHGDSLLEVSGGITSIGAGAELQLDGAQSRVSLGTGTTNSGLSGLTSNAGTIDFEGDWDTGPGGTSVTTSGGFTNTGTLSIDVDGNDGASAFTIGGILTNTGTLAIGNADLSAATTLSAEGLVNDRNITLQGNASNSTDQASLIIAAAAPTTLYGSWSVFGEANVAFTGGGSVQTIAFNSLLELAGAGARLTDHAGHYTDSQLSEVDGQLLLRGDSGLGAGGASLTTSVGLTVGGGGRLDVDPDGGDGGSNLTIGGTLTNSGAVNIGNSSLSASTTVKAEGLTNNNAIVLHGNSAGGTTDRATLQIAAAAPTTLIGYWYVTGDAEVDFTGGGSVQTIAAGTYLEMDGAKAGFASGNLSNLSEVDGQLVLRGDTGLGAGGVSLTTSVGLTIGGTVDVDPDGGDGGSNLGIGGTLTNNGTLNIGNSALSGATIVITNGFTNNGTITLTGGDGNQAELFVNAANATNTGSVTIDGGGLLLADGASGYIQTQGETTIAGLLDAETVNANGGLINFTAALTSGDGTGALDIGAAGMMEVAGVDSSHTVTFEASTGALDLSAPGSFAGTIAGFSSADVIDLLDDPTVTSLSFSSGTLTVKDGGATVASLNFSGSYTTDSFAFGSDGNGGTYIVDPPSSGSSTVASKSANLVQALAAFGNDQGSNHWSLPTAPSLSQDTSMLAATAHG